MFLLVLAYLGSRRRMAVKSSLLSAATTTSSSSSSSSSNGAAFSVLVYTGCHGKETLNESSSSSSSSSSTSMKNCYIVGWIRFDPTANFPPFDLCWYALGLFWGDAGVSAIITLQTVTDYFNRCFHRFLIQGIMLWLGYVHINTGSSKVRRQPDSDGQQDTWSSKEGCQGGGSR